MKLAIIEDRPWIMMRMLGKIRDIIPEEEILLIYYVNSAREESEYEEQLCRKCKEMKVEFKKIQDDSFEDEMNKLYDDQDRIFFIDLILDDNSDFFEERVNVRFAMERKQDKRIWFYTTSGKYNISKIKKEFGDQHIPVIDYDVEADELIFQEDILEKILNKRI